MVMKSVSEIELNNSVSLFLANESHYPKKFYWLIFVWKTLPCTPPQLRIMLPSGNTFRVSHETTRIQLLPKVMSNLRSDQFSVLGCIQARLIP